MTGSEHFLDKPANELEEFLLRLARTDVAPAEARERALRNVASAALGASVLSGTVALGSRSSVLKGTSWLVAKWLMVGAGTGLLGIGVVQGIQELIAKPAPLAARTSAAQPKPTVPLAPLPEPLAPAAVLAKAPNAGPAPVQPSQVAVAAPPAVAPSALANEPKSTSRASSEPSVLVFPPPNTKTSLTHELTLLEQTRGALKQHAVGTALQLLDQYRAEFPHGSMQTQAEALRVEALSEVSTAGTQKP